MRRSSFRPLARIRFGIVGQDRALEQLFRVLSIHDNQKASTPIVMLLCGELGAFAYRVALIDLSSFRS